MINKIKNGLLFIILIVFVYSYFFINNFSLILFIFFVIIVYTHRENIVRLKNSEESKIKL